MGSGDMARQQPTTVIATDVVTLWPQGLGARAVTVDEARMWPVFVLVVNERRDLVTSSARALFDLLDSPRRRDEITAVRGSTHWTVVDWRRALLRLTVRADAPVRFESDILMSAGRVLGILDVVARGAAIGITTRRHADSLGDRVDIRTALRHVVLVNCAPSVELDALAHLLWGAQP